VYAMRVQRNKQFRRYLAFYKLVFGIRPTYHVRKLLLGLRPPSSLLQVLLDGNLIHHALKLSVDLHEGMPRLLLGSEVVLHVTKCVIAELQSLGDACMDALHFTKSVHVHKCGHKHPLGASECIRATVGDTNEDRWMVATQDSELKDHMRAIPGVPLIFMSRVVLHMEAVSKVSHAFAERVSLCCVRLPVCMYL
jgi:U3 small nucleolar RNA-associated protein 23